MFRGDGTTQFADAAARPWLDVHEVELSIGREVVQLASTGGRQVLFSVLGAEVKLTALEGRGGVIYLTELRPAQPLRLSAGAHLTPMQRRVAEYAATGSTVVEIARSLAVAPETVRTHLREIYRRLAVSNRVELLRAMG